MLTVAALQHLLTQNAWARELLARHAGKVLAVEIPPLRQVLRVAEDGQVAYASAEQVDATVCLTPGAVLAQLAVGRYDRSSVVLAGDEVLAQDMAQVLAGLRWDAEADASRVLGDVAGHRLAGMASSFFDWQRRAVQSFAQSAALYATEENPVIPREWEVKEFASDVDDLRDKVASLAKRIEALEARLS